MTKASRTQAKAVSAQLFLAPVRGSLLQRKCACGGSAGVSGQCARWQARVCYPNEVEARIKENHSP